jgi:hypothetical protein
VQLSTQYANQKFAKAESLSLAALAAQPQRADEHLPVRLSLTALRSGIAAKRCYQSIGPNQESA